jgi:hypothetical protein
MNCCQTVEASFQRYPRTGNMSANKDIELKELMSATAHYLDVSPVYSYVMTSVKYKVSEYRQEGCGPNIEGKHITLCTCKHMMRCSMEAGEWEKRGVWIAGLSSSTIREAPNGLFYLMKVQASLESHYELWNSGLLSASELTTKSTRRNRLGDIFEPTKGPLKGPELFSYKNYRTPRSDHAHFRDHQWREDIYYKRWDRCAALLVGDPLESYLWSKRKLLYRGVSNHPRSKYWNDLGSFLQNFVEAKEKYE